MTGISRQLLSGLTAGDQLYFEQAEETMVEDEVLQVQARANTLENSKFGV